MSNENAATEEKAPILVPELTEARLAENAAFQVEWRKKANIPDYLQSPGDAWRVRDEIAEADLFQTIAILRHQIASFDNPDLVSELRAKLIEKSDELAEIFFSRGEFDFALQYAGSDARGELYRAFVAAQNLPDGQVCEHWEANSFLEKVVPHSEKYGGAAGVFRCNACSFRNMRALRGDEVTGARI